MTLAERTKTYLEAKRREWAMENPDQPTTKKAFSAWLGVSEWVYSDFTSDAPRPPTRKQLRKIAKHYPDIYDAIGVPGWKRAEERSDKRLESLARLTADFTPEQFETLKQLAKTLKPSDDDGEGDSEPRPFVLATE